MNRSDFDDLVYLIRLLLYLSDSELLWKIVKDAGYVPSSFDLDILLNLLADRIYLNLTGK